MQNDIAKFKTTSLGQDKNSNFAPAQTQIPGLALLLLCLLYTSDAADE